MTLLVDVFSRCILGFCLTLEKPKVLSIALCLAHAICPKDEWMRVRGLGDYRWPVYGRPKKIQTDRGKDFVSDSFTASCEDFGIELRRRNRGRVHEGGVVERLLGKVNRVIGSRFGGTGRTIAHRDGYPAEERACLTFDDLEKCVALAVIEHNSQENKKTLKVPLKVWEAVANQIPMHNDDAVQVLLAFLPGEGRYLHQQGISILADDYYSDWLGPLVPERDRLGKLMVKYDPRDISHVYVRHPQTREFLPVGRRSKDLTPMTLWEHERNRREQRAENHRTATEKVRERRHMAEISNGAQKRRKAELREAARSKHAHAAEKPHQSLASAPTDVLEKPIAPPKARPKLTVEDW